LGRHNTSKPSTQAQCTLQQLADVPTGVLMIAEDMKATTIQLVQKPIGQRVRTGRSQINNSTQGSRGGG